MDEHRDRSLEPGRRSSRSIHEVHPLLRDVLERRDPGRALDVATGLGRNAVALADRGWTVDAVDISRAQLTRARSRTRGSDRPGSIDWILADVDRYCLRSESYGLVAVSFFDARDRLPALKAALEPGGVLFYEHYLEAEGSAPGPGAEYRFAPGELRAACDDLRIRSYAEDRSGDQPLVTLLARADG